MKFGQLLRQLREKAGMSCTALAHELKVSVTYVSDVERGTRPPFTATKVLQTAEALKLDPMPLLCAAAKHSGAFTLDFRGEPLDDETAAYLCSAWGYLTETELETINRIAQRALARAKRD